MLSNSPPHSDDPRVKRTHKLLWLALRTLLEQRPFEEISVTDICEEATINRTTFYKHFESKYDLLSYGIKYDQEIARGKQRQARNAAEREQELIQMFANISSDYRYYEQLLVDKENQLLSTLLRRQTAEVVEAQLLDTQRRGHHFTMPLPIIAQFYAGASLALATWWLENRDAVAPDELARYWYRLCVGEEPLPEIKQTSPEQM